MFEKTKASVAAKTVYDDFCSMLDSHDWVYDKKDDFVINTGCRLDENTTVAINIHIDAEKSIISVVTTLPYSVPAVMQREMSVAVARANHGMVHGFFDYSHKDGRVYFRLTSCYRNSKIGKSALEYLIGVSMSTVNDYIGKFSSVISDRSSIDKIVQSIS